jgi:hypothetical protein
MKTPWSCQLVLDTAEESVFTEVPLVSTATAEKLKREIGSEDRPCCGAIPSLLLLIAGASSFRLPPLKTEQGRLLLAR